MLKAIRYEEAVKKKVSRGKSTADTFFLLIYLKQYSYTSLKIIFTRGAFGHIVGKALAPSHR